MDIHIICYGLGNQLSQYAFFLNRRALNQRAHAFYAFKQHNGYELDRIFGLSEGLPWYLQFVRVIFRLGISRRFYSGETADFVLSLFRIKIVTESSYRFDPSLLKPWSGIRILFGGWHDPRYFHPSEETVKAAYRFPELDETNQAIARNIDTCHSVSMHIRRSDYLKGKNSELFGGIATVAYYRNAINWVREHGTPEGVTPRFYVFSDDIEWCKQSLDLSDAVFVNVNSGTRAWQDMALMSRCKINIIANSTFSWWAAWLNPDPNKVVLCPTKFTNADTEEQTIYPPDWLHIEG